MTRKVSAEEKLRHARYSLNSENPFFGYLTMHLDIEEAEGEAAQFLEAEDTPFTIRSDEKVFYNEEKVMDLNDAEIQGALAHMVMHLATSSFDRRNEREPGAWDIATDVKINSLMKQNGMATPNSPFTPENEDYIDLSFLLPDDSDEDSLEIRDLSNRNAEQVYDIINDKGDPDKMQAAVEETFDNHEESEEDDSTAAGEDQADADEWANRMSKAKSHAEQKQQGDEPSGIDRYIDEVLQPQIDWKTILQQYMTRLTNHDYSWNRPNKKYRAHGHYLPRMKSESVNVTVLLDTSGSISDEELALFVSEISSMVNGFEFVNLDVVQHTTDVYKHERFSGSSISREQLKNMDLKSGGTNHVPAFNYVRENNLDPDVIVSLTDMASSFPDRSEVQAPVIWLVPENTLGSYWSMSDVEESVDYGRFVYADTSV